MIYQDKMSEDIRIKLGNKIRELRKEKVLSIRGLAKFAGVNKSTIVNLEAGRFNTRLEIQYKIACGLGVFLKDLLNF